MPSPLKAKIESLLFITNQPLTIKRLSNSTQATTVEVQTAVAELAKDYNNRPGGLKIQTIGEQVLMVTNPDCAKLVKDFIKEETTSELTKASLETLTIIAYRGPISRAELEQLRGVNCAVILRNLSIRGLIESTSDAKKMLTTYSVTFDFLKFLGLNSPAELPDYTKLNSSESLQALLAQADSVTKQ